MVFIPESEGVIITTVYSDILSVFLANTFCVKHNTTEIVPELPLSSKCPTQN